MNMMNFETDKRTATNAHRAHRTAHNEMKTRQ